MTPFKKMALASAIAGLTMGAGVAQAHVAYNLSAGASSGPDDLSSTGPWSAGAPSYSGGLPATWFAEIHNAGGVAQSRTVCNSAATCGAASMATHSSGAITLGMGAKSYKDGATNWGHSADYGLFELHHEAEVTITVSSDGSDLRPAFGLWSGWDTGGGSRHGAYLGNGALSPMAANPLSSTGLAVVDSSAWAFAPSQGPTASATLTRWLTAGTYTLILGGYDGTTLGGNLPYKATISAAAVPVPAAAWLFGAALTSLVGVHRRRRVVPL